jgi:hypothetical protein
MFFNSWGNTMLVPWTNYYYFNQDNQSVIFVVQTQYLASLHFDGEELVIWIWVLNNQSQT